MKKTETRVYVIDLDEVEELYKTISDEDFMGLAEQGGRVYTLEGFQREFNEGIINSVTDVIRFVSVETHL